MVTAEITKLMTARGKQATLAAQRKFLMTALSRQVSNGSLDKSVYRYMVRILMPKSPGFHIRWESYFSRYQQIRAVEKSLSGRSDWERLQALLKALSDQAQVVTAIDTLKSHCFEPDKQEQVAQFGYAGVCKSQRERMDKNGEFTDLLTVSVFTPNESVRVKLLSAFQLYGFCMYEPETNVYIKKNGYISLIGTAIQHREAA